MWHLRDHSEWISGPLKKTLLFDERESENFTAEKQRKESMATKLTFKSSTSTVNLRKTQRFQLKCTVFPPIPPKLRAFTFASSATPVSGISPGSAWGGLAGSSPNVMAAPSRGAPKSATGEFCNDLGFRRAEEEAGQ